MPIQYRALRTNLFADTTRADYALRGSGSAASATDWTSARRTRPLNHLLPMTTRWAESLPELGRPVMLMRLYPRIANRIASAWRDPEAARAVFDDLLVDRRGGRQGFPPLVLAELLHLRTLLYRAKNAPPQA